MLDVVVEYIYDGSHSPASDREIPERKLRMLVKPTDDAASIQDKVFERAALPPPYQILGTFLESENGFEMAETDCVGDVSSGG